MTGNHQKLLNWQWPFIRLDEISMGVWETTLSLPQRFRLEYDFNLGSAECVGLDSTGNILGRLLLNVTADTTVTIEITRWRQGKIHISDETLGSGSTIQLTDFLWKYHPGDNNEWAKPEFDDGAWELVEPELRPNDLPISGWKGVGWFRLNIIIDSTFSDKSLAITGYQSGNMQIYWDGKLTYQSLDRRIPKELLTGDKSNHVLAVRYTSPSISRLHELGNAAGFFIIMGDFGSMTEAILQQRSEQMFFTALPLAFGLLHLFLFLFSTSAKGNFYYAVFLFIIAITTFVDIQSSYFARHFESVALYLRIHRALVPLSAIFFLRFVYSIFYKKCPRQFWIFTLLFVVVGIIIFLNPQTHYHYFVLMSILAYVEISRMIITSIKKKKDGAWIFATGILCLFLFSAYDALLDLGIMAPFNQITNAYYFGSIGLFIATSIYLARDFARTNQKLLVQERRTREEEFARKLVEADNKRKTKELEEARSLQLSMLPQCTNDIPGIDICFHMQTATEVGGDYYDYHLADDGTLTIAIGDATGHGMKAGTMVSVIKSLFIAQTTQTDILTFFKNCSQTIRKMRLGNLYMALMLVKIKEHKMTVSSAGIPPIYIYRSETKSVEEMVIKGMPLGGASSFTYDKKETTLAPGDAVFLMSDGFPELFNDQGEMLDYSRIKDIFKEAAEKTATEIVKHLFLAGKNWSNGRPQDDDITFVVLKVKE